jgi:large subunit ribosomal protein L9
LVEISLCIGKKASYNKKGENVMKVILREDLENLGKCGDIVEVKSGYGRNYLLPRNLAIPASRGNLKAIGEVTAQKTLRDKKLRREAERIKDHIEKVSCTAEVNVGEEDRMFGSITTTIVADLLKAEGITVDRRKILLEEPIKNLGVYTVPIKVATDVIANLKLWVVKKS